MGTLICVYHGVYHRVLVKRLMSKEEGGPGWLQARRGSLKEISAKESREGNLLGPMVGRCRGGQHGADPRHCLQEAPVSLCCCLWPEVNPGIETGRAGLNRPALDPKIVSTHISGRGNWLSGVPVQTDHT